MKLTLALALGLAAAAPAQAANTSANTEQAAAQADKPKDKMICKRETSVGSNLATKVCKTEAQWKAELDRARERFQDRDKD